MRDDLGVGFGQKGMSLAGQQFFKGLMIFNNAIAGLLTYQENPCM